MSLEKPVFSVVIPTRGRTHVVAWAIQSVLSQTFPDFECVVIDNNVDDRVEKICAQFSDPRLRRVKTGDLNMADNWEEAYLSARGTYVIAIEDRQCLYRHALSFINELAEREDLQCVGWNNDHFHDATLPARIRRHGGDRSLKRVRSDDVLEGCCGRDTTQDPMEFIVAQKCAVKVNLLEKIRAQTGTKLSQPAIPDITVGLHIVNALETYHYFNGSLSLSHSFQISTGHNFHKNKNAVNEFWAALGGKEMAYTHTPVKACFNENSFFNDYLRLSEVLGGRLQAHPVDWVYYYTKLAIYLLQVMGDGHDWKEEWEAWEAALAKEPLFLRKAVWKNLGDRKRRRVLQQLRVRLGIRAVERMLPWKKKKVVARVHDETPLTVPEVVAAESLVLAGRDLASLRSATLKS